MQCDQYFPIFSYFVDLYEITAKYEKRENTGHIAKGKHAITSLSLTYTYLPSVNSSFIKGCKQKTTTTENTNKKHNNKFLFLITNN